MNVFFFFTFNVLSFHDHFHERVHRSVHGLGSVTNDMRSFISGGNFQCTMGGGAGGGNHFAKEVWGKITIFLTIYNPRFSSKKNITELHIYIWKSHFLSFVLVPKYRVTS